MQGMFENKERFSSRKEPGYQLLVKWSLCSSNSLDSISLVRASGERFERRFFDALERARDACLLCELFCRRVALPDALLLRSAPRLELRVVFLSFGIDMLF